MKGVFACDQCGTLSEPTYKFGAAFCANCDSDTGCLLINLTPHALNVVGSEGEFVIPPSGQVARMTVEKRLVRTVGPIELYETHPTGLEGLPEPRPGVLFIVSSIIKYHIARSDLLCPGELIRDEQGRVVGCRGLSR